MRFLVAVISACGLIGCKTTSMQGYADRQLPTQPISRIVTYVAGPGALVSSIQFTVREEARKRGMLAEDTTADVPGASRDNL